MEYGKTDRRRDSTPVRRSRGPVFDEGDSSYEALVAQGFSPAEAITLTRDCQAWLAEQVGIELEE